MTATPAEQTLRLAPVEGPTGEPYEVNGDQPALIGRSRECEITLAAHTVSRRHATIERRNDRWMVIDHGSRHGTQLNGIPLQAERPVSIAAGDFLRVGPYAFRLDFGESVESSMPVRDDSIVAGTLVERISRDELDSVAQRRLELLIDGAAALDGAQTEEALAEAILQIALDGSGYGRAAYLRPVGAADRIEVIASRESAQSGDATFSCSQSLLNEARAGHVARLTTTDRPYDGHSIVQLDIQAAVCAPIAVGASVMRFLYLDSRATEPQGYADAAGFCHAVARLAGLTLSSLKRAELEQRQARLEADLSAAHEAQAFLIPDPQGVVGTLEYALRTVPGRVVAGDLFDIFRLDDHHVGICFGDVSGQGMAAALLMTAILAHLRAFLAHEPDAAGAATKVNRYIADQSPSNMFASLWIGVFDERTNSLRYVDAGHGHWFIHRRGAAEVREPGRPGGMLIGIEADLEYDAETLELAPGDRFILYSDGVIEHRNTEGEQFGKERVSDILRSTETPTDDVSAVIDSLRQYIGRDGLDDDTTIASILVGS